MPQIMMSSCGLINIVFERLSPEESAQLVSGILQATTPFMLQQKVHTDIIVPARNPNKEER